MPHMEPLKERSPTDATLSTQTDFEGLDCDSQLAEGQERDVTLLCFALGIGFICIAHAGTYIDDVLTSR